MTSTHYSSGISDAVLVRQALREDRIGFSKLAVLPVGGASDPLYSKCHARFFRSDGVVLRDDYILPQLERDGVAMPLNRAILDLVLDWLDADSFQVLGCSISAQNLERPADWFELYTRIARRPHLARRLVLEITKARRILRPDQARDVLNALRAVGVRVALDDFGTGFATSAVLSRLEVDIVKIDAQFTDSLVLLRNLVAQALSSSATAVVIQGVHTAAQREAAAEAGATHIQGLSPGPPRRVPLRA